MKRTIALILALILCLSLCACGKESSGGSGHREKTTEEKGVPDEIILDEYESNFSDAADYTISHNVNTETHIDHVTVEITREEKYATVTDIFECQYQYDRSSDLWSLLDHSWLDSAPDLKEEMFIGQWQDDGSAYWGVSTVRIYEFSDNYVYFSFQAGKENRALFFNLPLEYDEYIGWHVSFYEENYLYDGWSETLEFTPDGLGYAYDRYTYVGPLE